MPLNQVLLIIWCCFSESLWLVTNHICLFLILKQICNHENYEIVKFSPNKDIFNQITNKKKNTHKHEVIEHLLQLLYELKYILIVFCFEYCVKNSQTSTHTLQIPIDLWHFFVSWCC